LDLHLQLQSVTIIAKVVKVVKVVKLKGNVYFIQHYVIKFISDLIFLKKLVKVALNTLTLQILFNIQV